MVAHETRRFSLSLTRPLDSNPSPFLPRNVLFAAKVTNISSNAMYHVFSGNSGGHFHRNSFDARLKSGTAASSIEIIY